MERLKTLTSSGHAAQIVYFSRIVIKSSVYLFQQLRTIWSQTILGTVPKAPFLIAIEFDR